MKKTFILLSLIVVGATASAQFSLPSMEVSLKGGHSFVSGSDTDLEGMNLTASFLVHINENIAVGPFISRGLDMNFDVDDEADQLILGLNARLSTNRNGFLRPYLNLSYFKLELLEEFDSFVVSQKTSGFGVGVGLMIKLNRNLYLNAVEVSARQISDDIFFLEGANYVIQIQTGLSYNFSKKK